MIQSKGETQKTKMSFTKRVLIWFIHRWEKKLEENAGKQRIREVVTNKEAKYKNVKLANEKSWLLEDTKDKI